MKRQLGSLSLFVLALLLIVFGGLRGTATASEAPVGVTASTAAISQNVAWVGHVSGTTGVIAVRGNYAYAGEGPRLTVLNIANPAAPVVVGQSALLPVTIGDLAVAGNYVYAVEASGGEGGLRVFNVANPAAPVEVAYRATPGSATSVAIAGNYAYVVGYDDVLRVFNVANPAAPVEVGALDTPSCSCDVVVVGNYAYVTVDDYYGGGLRIINVANPAAPVEVGALVDDDIAAEAVAVSGSYAYVQGGDVWVINVANPAAPVEVGQFSTSALVPNDIAVTGNYAYLAVYGGLQILNVANPAAPVEVATYETPGFSYHLAVAGTHVYLAAESGTHVINVANPAAPVEVGARRTPPATDVAVSGNYAYVSDEIYGLRIMNVANPAAPVEVGALTTPGYMSDVVVVGNYAYVADGSAGLQILSVANPAAPVRLGGIDLPGWATDVAVAGHYAYVATDDDFDGQGHHGLRIINVANPAAPVEVAAYDTPGWAVGVAVAGHYAYVADYNGLVIIDVANPAAPTAIGSYAHIGAQRVAVAGDYAYVSNEWGGLQVINVANPAAPLGAGYFDTPDAWLWEAELSVAGNYAYLAHEDQGLRIIDVTNPAAPAEVGFYDTAARAFGVAAAGPYVYVADSGGGLVVLHFTALPSADQQLANRYAPIVRMHSDDRMVPMSVDLALQHAICLKRQPGISATCATSGAVTTALLAGDAWRNEADAYIDFGGNPTGSGEQGSQYYFVLNVMNAARQAPLVYAQVTPDNRSDGRRVVQYWIYYYHNLWWNKHEGDWEMVQVELDAAGRAEFATYAQHGDGSKREWASVARYGDHPIVYPGLGSHASYFFPGSYLLGRDTTATATQYEEWQPSAQLLSAASATWLTFAGHWGEKDVLPGQSGPSSPARTPAVDNPKWYDPLWWSSQQAFDEQAEHNRGKLRLSAALDCRVGIEDKVTGQKWGWIDGALFNEIPSVEEIRNASLSQTTTILHGDLGQFQQKYRVSLEGCGLAAPGQTSPAAAGAPLAVIEFADSATNEVVRLTYDVPAGWDAATSAAEVTLSPVEPATLRVDLNGDDTIDLSAPPTSSGETPLYPLPVADFAAAPLSGSAALPVTFADASTGWPDSWLWEFGDGQTSTDQNPTHLYQQAGVYTVTLSVSNPTGSDTETRSAYVTVTTPPPPAIYLSPTAAGKLGVGPTAKTFTGADILAYNKAGNAWDVLYDGSIIKTTKNVGAFTFLGDEIVLGFSAAQTVPGLGKAAPQDLVRFAPTALGYNNTAGSFAWFFDGSDVGLTTSAEAIDALWLDDAGRLYVSTAGAGEVPVNSAQPTGAKFKFQDEDVLRFTPAAGSSGANTAGAWELYWDTTGIVKMGAEDVNGYWEDPATGDRYLTILGPFTIGSTSTGGVFTGNGATILRFAPNAAAPGGWAPAGTVAWLAPGATLPAKFAIDGLEMSR